MKQALQDHEQQIQLLQNQITLQNNHTEILSKQVIQQTVMIHNIHKIHTAQGKAIMNAIQHMSYKQTQPISHEQNYNMNQQPMQMYASQAQKRGNNSITTNTHKELTPQPT